MGLYRTALRLAALESIRPSALDGASDDPRLRKWPTLAGSRVYDSRIDPLEDLAQGDYKAVIGVYVQDEIGYGGQHRGGPPFRREVDLCFEISHIAHWQTAESGDQYSIGTPITDPQLEAELDAIQSQIYFALAFAGNGPTLPRGSDRTTLFRWLTGNNLTDPRAVPHRDSEEGVRLSWRSVTYKVQVPDDTFPPLPTYELTGLDRLPEPLQTIAKALPDNSYGAQLCCVIAGDFPTMPIAVPLRTFTLGAEIVRRGATATGEPNLSGTVSLTGYPPEPPAAPALDSNP